MQIYTAREIMEMIDHAAVKGVSEIKVPGFEIKWKLSPPKQSVGKPEESPLGEYVIPIGARVKNYKLKEANRVDVQNLMKHLESSEELGEPLSPKAKEFIEKARQFFALGN